MGAPGRAAESTSPDQKGSMVKSTIINDKPRNVARLQSALAIAQGRASARLLNLNRLRAFANEAERELEQLGLPKYLRTGCTAEITPEYPPLAYKYRADSTVASLTRRSTGWALVSVSRTTVYPIRYGCAMGLSLTRSDGALQHQLTSDAQLWEFVRRKIREAEQAISTTIGPASNADGLGIPSPSAIPSAPQDIVAAARN